MSLFELTETPTAADLEHDEANEPSPTARVISMSHACLAVDELVMAHRLLRNGEGFEGLAALERAGSSISNAIAHLNGTVWNVDVNAA